MPKVETSTPANTPTPIGPARTVIGVRELPRPGVRLTMNLTAVTVE